MSSGFQVRESVTVLPAVSKSENGTGKEHTTRSVYDDKGRTVWEKSPRGYVTHSTYHPVTGVMTQRVEDVQLSNTTLLPAPPSRRRQRQVPVWFE